MIIVIRHPRDTGVCIMIEIVFVYNNRNTNHILRLTVSANAITIANTYI